VATTEQLGHRLRAGPSHVWQMLNDWWLKIETAHDPRAVSEEYERGGLVDYRAHYQGANYLYLEQIARLLTRNAPHRLVFYDVGCGKGRPLCVMARHAFRKVVGVELRESLCEIARENARQLRGRVAPIEVVCADAANVDYSDGHVFFFFNPFGAPTLQAVLDCIERSLRFAPRQITIIYYNAVHETVLERCPWLYNHGVLPTFSGVRVSFWRNREMPAKKPGVA
jgi:SAM-dependent methyltransferase